MSIPLLGWGLRMPNEQGIVADSRGLEGVSVSHVANPAKLRRVESDIGQRVQQRRVKLGMSVSGLAERAKVDRGTLTSIEAGSETVQDVKIAAVEAALDKLEYELGMDVPFPPSESGDRFVVRIKGTFGVEVEVEGSVRDIETLQAFVDHEVAKMQGHSNAD